MWPAFPASDYYGSSAPPRRHQPATGLPADQLAAGRGGDRRDGSHVHSRTVRRGRRPAMPLQHRHGYAAGLHRGLPAGDIDPAKEFPARPACGCALLPSPDPPGSSWWVLLRGVQPLVPHVHLSVSLAGPGPSGSAGPSRRCQGCFPPSPASPGSGCPQLQPARCDEPAAVSFHHRTVQERLVALDVPAPQLVRAGSASSSGSGMTRVGALVAALAGLPGLGQDAVHRALRGEVDALVQQGGDHLGWGGVAEPLRVKHRPHRLAFGV